MAVGADSMAVGADSMAVEVEAFTETAAGAPVEADSAAEALTEAEVLVAARPREASERTGDRPAAHVR
jgi:hypothetical protein